MPIPELDKIFDHYKVVEKDRHPYDVLSHEVYIVDPKHEILYADEKKKQKYGNDIIGKKCYEVFPIDKPRELPCSGCPCEEILSDRSDKPAFHHERFETTDKDGKLRYISETAVPLTDEIGNRVLALVLGRNITKRVRLENIKKEFYETLGSDYDIHLKLVVDRLHEIGYNRVRFYDVIDDCLSKNNPLFVLRAKAGRGGSIPDGYSFHLNDKGYHEVLRKLTKQAKANEVLSVNSLTEPKLLKSWDFSPGNKCIKDLGLENTPWIILPLLAQQKPENKDGDQNKRKQKKLVGLLSVDNKDKVDNKGKDKPVTSDDLGLLRNFADFLGEAIVAVRAEMNLRILNKISELITQKRVEAETHDLIAKEVCENMKAGMCSIFIYSDASRKLERHANYISKEILSDGNFGPEGKESKEEYAFDSPFMTAKSFREGSCLNIFDFHKIRYASERDKREYEKQIGEVSWNYVDLYESYAVKKTGKKRFEIKNAVFAPLKFEDHNIGVIRVVNNIRDGRYPFPDSDIDLLKSIALQIAAHSHYEGMKEDLNSAISKISSAIAARQFNLPNIAQNIVDTVKQISKAFAVTLFLTDDDHKKLISIAKAGYPKDFKGELEYSLDVNPEDKGIGITAWVALKKEPFKASKKEQIEKHGAHSGNYEKVLYGNRHAESLIALPMKIDDKIIGVFKVEDYEPNKFGKSFSTMFDILANLTSLAINSLQEIKRREELMIVLGHELATPAIALASMGAVMKKEYSVQEDIPPEIETLMVQKNELLDYCSILVAESKHLTFITSSREALDPYADYKFGYFSLNKLLKEVIDVLQPYAKWKYLEISSDKNAPKVAIEMDKNKLKQPIHNLLYNAIKYSHKNNAINVIWDHDDEYKNVILKIQDFGIGVPEKDVDVIFDKGKRGSNAPHKDPTGAGYGLYYSRLIIENHRGTIKLTNRKNPTEFTITLPITQPVEDKK
nr:GAF domain-containing protein [candidate division Zixibacteria bacterium]